jgi:benzoyl-CoA reductase/2-hydroxyglutaryl-CoA dehydratase subunit BcrC/BadD/HgdB
LRYDERCDSKSQSRLPLPQFVYFAFAKKFGVEEVADTHITQLQLALLHHRHHRRVRLLGLTLGSYDVSNPPKVTCRDFDVLMKVLQFLRSYDAFSDEAITVTLPDELKK